ncbi:MAG: B12-binding domain-containing radical SAM protein [Lentisphaerae bacterium]|nr:B12-binding domain-containing radical SAM protein [Lentisphaerota bacterium]
MKVLFVYPDIGVRGGARSYQFGIGLLSALLRTRGHATSLYYMFGDYNPAALKRAVAMYQPGLIAFSAVSPQFRFVKQIFKDLAPFPAFTILGGHHATLAPECLQTIEGLDAICIGEGEYPLLELVETLERGGEASAIPNLWVKTRNQGIAKNATRPFTENLDTLPFVDRELFDYQAIINSDFHTAQFMFSRGCPYNCTFCSNHALRERQDGKYVRFRGVPSCLAEIREVTGRYRMRALYFNDDCFTTHRNFVDEFCTRYSEEFALPFAINARPETLNDDICRVLKAAGCQRLSIGIESGSESFRQKVLGRRQSNERIVAAFAAARRAGIKTKSFNIVGFPYETPAIFQETVDLNERIQPDSVIIGIFEPYPGTRLAEICLQEGFLPSDQPDAWFLGRMDTILNMPAFPRRAILRCFRNFAFNVYKKSAPLKAFFYKAYYSAAGERLIRLLAPVKDLLRRLVMGV